MKKLVAFALMLAVSMFTFAGCGDTTKKKEEKKTTTESSKTVPDKDKEAPK